MACEKFQIGDRVVYSSHGVGEIVDIKVDQIGDHSIEMYVVEVEDEESGGKVMVSVPVAQEGGCVLRSLIGHSDIEGIIKVLREPSKRDGKVAWNRRLNDYNIKKGTGDLNIMAEVVRDLHKFAKNNTNISNSEKVVYNDCLMKLVREFSIVLEMEDSMVKSEIGNVLDGLQDTIRSKRIELVEEDS